MLLERYIQAATLRSVAVVAVGLTALFSLLEFVDQLHDVGQGAYHLPDALEYVLLTAPSRLSQLMPVSMLLGGLLGLGGLSGHSELTAMRSIGIPRRRIIRWELKLILPLTIALFLIAEFVIPPAQRLAQVERITKISTTGLIRAGNGLWAEGNHQYLNVQRFGYDDTPQNLDIYAFSDKGELQQFIHADSAEIRPDGTWQLSGVLTKQFNQADTKTERLPSLSWPAFLRPEEVRLLSLPPDAMPPVELYRYVRELRREQHPSPRLEQELWTKIDIPLAMIGMILVAIPLVFVSPRANSTGLRITMGAIIGIVFTLVQQITGLVSLLFNQDTTLPALVPLLLLVAFARYLFYRANI